jgi:hypothetical protein
MVGSFKSIGRQHRSPLGASGHGAAERGAVPMPGVSEQHEATRAGGAGPGVGRLGWRVSCAWRGGCEPAR